MAIIMDMISEQALSIFLNGVQLKDAYAILRSANGMARAPGIVFRHVHYHPASKMATSNELPPYSKG